MDVAIRADASLQLGTGHVMRCLTLAEALKDRGARCRFVCRDHPGHLGNVLLHRGFGITLLPRGDGARLSEGRAGRAPSDWSPMLGASWEDDAAQTSDAMGDTSPDWLVVDHYSLDYRWERALQASCENLLVIDDLADRTHDCDVLVDQNLGRVQSSYSGLDPSGTRVLAGPRFALLRPEFAALRDFSLRRREAPALERIMVSMGGVDMDDATGEVLKELSGAPLSQGTHISVVMGASAPWLRSVRARAASMPWPTEVHVAAENMARLMAASDLAIGAAGTTSWERCCLGLPSLVAILADNQAAGSQALEASGCAVPIGRPGSLGPGLLSALATVSVPDRLVTMSLASRDITDGLGTQRVAAELAGGHQFDG